VARNWHDDVALRAAHAIERALAAGGLLAWSGEVPVLPMDGTQKLDDSTPETFSTRSPMT